jgi:hypothetical protein
MRMSDARFGGLPHTSTVTIKFAQPLECCVVIITALLCSGVGVEARDFFICTFAKVLVVGVARS